MLEGEANVGSEGGGGEFVTLIDCPDFKFAATIVDAAGANTGGNIGGAGGRTAMPAGIGGGIPMPAGIGGGMPMPAGIGGGMPMPAGLGVPVPGSADDGGGGGGGGGGGEAMEL